MSADATCDRQEGTVAVEFRGSTFRASRFRAKLAKYLLYLGAVERP